jgi:hypothetical protein
MHNYPVFKCPWYIDLKEKKIILINQMKTIFISSLFFRSQILYCNLVERSHLEVQGGEGKIALS